MDCGTFVHESVGYDLPLMCSSLFEDATDDQLVDISELPST